MADLAQLRSEAEAAVRDAGSTQELEELRVRYLGRRSELTSTLRSIGELPPDQRGPVGKAANEVRVALEQLLGERTAELEASELDRGLAEDRIDVTGPVVLVLGSERGDLPDGLEAVRIPVHADSLNVAMAASVALYEVANRMAADG